jgi:hypothetical protein
VRKSTIVLILALASSAWSQETAPRPGERYWGGDPGARKYSELDQIHRGNVSELELAWVWKTGETAILTPERVLRPIEGAPRGAMKRRTITSSGSKNDVPYRGDGFSASIRI